MKTAFYASLLLTASAFAQAPVPSAGNVTLPLDEYNRMLELAAKPPKLPEGPPVPYLLKHAALNFRVENASVSGTLDFAGDLLAAGTREVPLVTGMTILDGRQAGAPLPLEHIGPTCHAVLTGPGEFALSLRGAVPLEQESGRAGFRFTTPSAGSVEMKVAIPGERTIVNLTSGLVTSRNSSGGETVVEATLEPGKPVEVWWATREIAAPAPPREVRFLSDVKTLVSLTEAALRLTSLVEVTVVQGAPDQFQIDVPQGYEVTTANGATLETSSLANGVLTLKLSAATGRMQQFLVSMEKPLDSGNQSGVPIPGVKGTQRETGEVMVESSAALELAAKESGALKRMDTREASPYLRQLVRDSVRAAFRYHRQPAETPGLALEWVRFPDAALPSALAERATATTLVTSEGKSLTEVKLVLSNQAQPFLKLALPAGASLVTAEVAGQPVKPLEAPDGRRVPLLRPGFRPNGLYTVSFVIMHSGAPFAKKGGSELALPKIDLPIGVLDWEVFLPSRFKVTDFGGSVVPAAQLPGGEAPPVAIPEPAIAAQMHLLPGQLGGIVTDQTGAAITTAQVTVAQTGRGASKTAGTDAAGRWMVYNIFPGRVRVTFRAPGFNMQVYELDYTADRTRGLATTLSVGSTNETVTVTAEAPTLNTSNATAIVFDTGENRRDNKKAAAQEAAASANVIDLQRRVSGVLPVAVDVPKTGSSYRFRQPLVVDEEATVSFTYKTK